MSNSNLRSIKPEVSVIMPNFNSELFIESAITSVISQSFENWELLICDDGSSDGSLEIISRYTKLDPRIKLLKNDLVKGAPGARNSALKIAMGRYIAFLDSDDIWYKDKLKIQISFMVGQACSMSYAYTDIIDRQGQKIRECLAPMKVSSKSLKYTNYMQCLTVMYDTHKFGKVLQPDIPTRNDFALWLTLLNMAENQFAFCITEKLGAYREGTAGISADRLAAIKYFNYCQIQFNGAGYFSAMFRTVAYLTISILKKKMPDLYNKLVTKVIKN